MGQRLVIVPLPWADVFIHLVSVEISRFGAVSTGEWAFLPPLICWFTVGSSGAFPRGNFWGSREGWVFQFSPWLSSV